MSRIHEALQRAYLERGKMSVSGDVDVAERAEVIPDLEERHAPSPKVHVALEEVAQYPWNPSMLSLPTLAERGAVVEQFRSLRSHVYQARYETPLKTILIASGMPGDGKSFVAANLAISLARNSVQNILLIDADLRRPTIHKLLGTPNSKGLSDYLDGTAELAEIMQRDKSRGDAATAGERNISNLTLIPSGKTSDNSSELVANHRIEELISMLTPQFDWIVIDAPPVLAVTDAVELARAADAVLLVARAARTPYEVAQKTKTAFGTSRILGYVLNGVKEAPRTGSYNYSYDYYHQHEPEVVGQAKGRKDTGSQG
jgi:capsular exopolysaccharide synthesis family protein